MINRIGSVPEKSDDTAFQRLTEALTALGAYGDRIGARLAAQTAETSPQDLARLIAALPDQLPPKIRRKKSPAGVPPQLTS